MRVGPSSTTSTRSPRIASASSTVTREFALTTVAVGFTSPIVASSRATCSGVAESILFTMIDVGRAQVRLARVIRELVPARSGSTSVIHTSGV